MSYTVVIPARYGASRLPGKPLRLIAGRTLVEHAWRLARESGAERVIVATDDERVATVAREFGAEVCITGTQHASGTDRIAEVARVVGLADDHIVVNLQCDEPQMPAALLDQVARAIAEDAEVSIATLCAPIREAAELFDPNVVKVVVNARGHALYFSRAPIPWARDAFARAPGVMPEGDAAYLRHIGLYAYRAGFLQEFVGWTPCMLERTEALEQLRALWHGRVIRVEVAHVRPGPGIDTEEDLTALRVAVEGSGPAG
ncbi:MAG: 3-deoxy-manno-octulosonate cytidylyltransferase [Gammaproteobacteria bacterium]|jgi:3-deoxy-manno-octulosonate cytidylyltransferase (CMP-KDO synthetase)|nr:3-deoxy-manno-octulosonate cytidylyltransferase [Gammaproteobacteria bacterium]